MRRFNKHLTFCVIPFKPNPATETIPHPTHVVLKAEIFYRFGAYLI